MKLVSVFALALLAQGVTPNPCNDPSDLKGGDDFVPNAPCGIQRVDFPSSISDLTSSFETSPEGFVQNTCDYSRRFNEYECICETHKCTDYLNLLSDGAGPRGNYEGGLIPEGPCIVEGYCLDKVRAWWWLCVPC